MASKIIIIEPDISKEENEVNLKQVEEILQKIARQILRKNKA
ncbi:hypothetical protein QJR52_07190 [Clostridium baratii]